MDPSRPAPPRDPDAPVAGRIWNHDPRAPRRFEVYGVGIAKTGSTSLAELYAPYRSGHEYLFSESVTRAWEHRAGRGGLHDFLRARRERGNLELDAATFHCFYIEALVEVAPHARWIVTRRDFPGWLDSWWHMQLWNHARLRAAGMAFPRWQQQLGELMFDSFDPADYRSAEALLDAAPRLAPPARRFWAGATARVLAAVPDPLVIETSRLSTSLDRLGAFVGHPPDPGAHHRNPGGYRSSLVARIDPRLLSD